MTCRRRIGAYILAADPTWLRSSLERYYDHLDVLVISASRSNRGWTGRRILADECVAIALALDTRKIASVISGEWQDIDHPMNADTRQRQDALAAMADRVNWVLQIDSDEILPDFEALRSALDRADALGLDVVDWPMQVLFRRVRGHYLRVVANNGQSKYEYPGPIAVRPSLVLVEARRVQGPFLRPVVIGDRELTEVTRPRSSGEVRLEFLRDDQAILHNSWARPFRDVRRKVLSWGHNQGLRSRAYLYGIWLPAPLRWSRMVNFHPLIPGLWPRLALYRGDVDKLLDPLER